MKAAEEVDLEDEEDKDESEDEEGDFTARKLSKQLVKNPVNSSNDGAWTPHQVSTAHKNKDGVRFCVVVVALTGGTVNATMDGVSGALAKDNDNEVVVTEEWSPPLNDMEQFCSDFDKNDCVHHGETEDFILRKVAMARAVRSMKQLVTSNGVITSVHHVGLPFKADPSSMKINFMGTEHGCCCVHINLCGGVKPMGDDGFSRASLAHCGKNKTWQTESLLMSICPPFWLILTLNIQRKCSIQGIQWHM